jgi:hypothetical protein
MDYRKVISFVGSLGVALVLAAAGLHYDAQALFYAGTILLAVVVVAWLFFWAHPLPKAVVQSGPEAARAAEEAKERQDRRRKIIDDARDLVGWYEYEGKGDWHDAVRGSPRYMAVLPHLSDQYKQMPPTRLRTIAVGALHQEPVASFVRELDRLEREWGLS